MEGKIKEMSAVDAVDFVVAAELVKKKGHVESTACIA